MTQPDIGTLLAACGQDMGALEQLYRLLKRELFAFTYSILQDPALAEDCVQETFVRLPGAAARLRDPRAGKSFIFSIARFAALELRRRQAAGEPPLTGEPAAPGDFTRGVEAAMLLGVLGEEERQILVLHAVNGWTFREIAALLDRPASTVKSAYARAKVRMEKEWRKHDDSL